MYRQDIYDKVADFLASLGPQSILDLKADSETQLRLDHLVQKEEGGGLDFAEKEELDHLIVLERLIRLAKAHALNKLKE